MKKSRSDDEPVEPQPLESDDPPSPEDEQIGVTPGVESSDRTAEGGLHADGDTQLGESAQDVGTVEDPAGLDQADALDDASGFYDTAELPVVPAPTQRTAAGISAPTSDPEESHTTEVRRAADLAELVGLSKARYTRDELRAKVDMGDTETDTATWWRAMGLVEVPAGTVAFNSDDLAMVRALKAVLADGDANEDHVLRLARLLGGSMSRIAEAQVSVIEDVLTNLELGVSMDTAGERSAALASDPAGALIDVFEQSMLYIWRRHLFASFGRWIGADPDHDSQAVGFVDISGYSHMSKRLDSRVLAEVIERFESEVVDVVSTHSGRVVKFIGDEAFFVTHDLPTAAHVALEMVERMQDGDPRVDVHGGIAYGPTVTIAGDVFGNTVNLAKRLTDVARKGKILMPKDDTELFEGLDDLAVRRMGRSFDFKGVGRTAAVSVSRRRAGDED